MTTKSTKAHIFIFAILLLGAAVLVTEAQRWTCADPVRYVCYSAVALLSSRIKISLPSISGSMSMAFLFTLIGVQELTLPETLLMIGVATVAQGASRLQKTPGVLPTFFSLSTTATAIFLCAHVYSASLGFGSISPIALSLAAATYFIADTLPPAAAASLSTGIHLGRVWHKTYFWSFPYYLIGAGIAGLFRAANRIFSWELTLLALPVVFVIYRSYRLYLGRLEDEKQHAQEQQRHAVDIASLHLRTIEALALAIEAKDHTTHDHLERVQVYAIEVGKELGMTGCDLDALRAAALLHDIGKLAVPEHIISKPGRLTQEEFDKMKIHPVVGAEILEQVQFPYPVAPIVRAHHERWNGKGYPLGIQGEDIPLGARILSAVDCLDALASDRQYRRALPLDEAIKVVQAESGVSFDPRVVEVLSRRYVELEAMANKQQKAKANHTEQVRVENISAPDPRTVPVMNRTPVLSPTVDFLQSIAAARQEVQALFEMTQELGNSLGLNETLSVLALKLKSIVPYDAIAIYILRDEKLVPEFVNGDDFRLFSSLEIPLGHGVSGWVAERRKPVLNGNPSVEAGYLNDPTKSSRLLSALAVPLEGLIGVVGVLTLYHAEKEAFSRDHLRILEAVRSKLSLSVENALKFQQAESSATTDYLTGLPNARSLFLHLDGEVARCRRMPAALAVLVCDLDGFKLVNDRFGHLEGNRVLQMVANGLRSLCREYDYVARMGGDEFVLILPGLPQDALGAKIESLAKMVSEAGFAVCSERVLSLSVGAAFYGNDGLDAEQLLTEADRRMYTEKQFHKSEAKARTAKNDLQRLSASIV